MNMSEEEPEKEKDLDLDSSDSEDEEDCEITDSEEQEPVQANTSALDTLITASQKHGAFGSTTFVYQRGPEPSERTLIRRSQEKRELRKAAENTPTLIEAYEAGEVYGTKEFAERIYKSHWRVVDKSR